MPEEEAKEVGREGWLDKKGLLWFSAAFETNTVTKGKTLQFFYFNVQNCSMFSALICKSCSLTV